MKLNSKKPVIPTQIMRRSSIGAAVLIMLSPLAGSAQNLLSNGSFETLTASVAATTAGSYTVNFGGLPVGVAAGWTLGISGNAGGYDGIAINTGVPVSNFNPMAIEDGNDAVFLQGAGSVSQTLTLAAGQYSLSYYAMGRTGSGGGNGANPFTASVSGGLVNDVETPANTDITSLSDWAQYTDNFTVTTPGSYTVEFSGNYPYGQLGDLTTFIDNVSIVAVPEPSTLALAGFGVWGLFFARRFSFARR